MGSSTMSPAAKSVAGPSGTDKDNGQARNHNTPSAVECKKAETARVGVR